jgi:hypothetical protein
MSAIVSPIGSRPRLRIARLVQLLVERQRLAALDDYREHLPVDHPYRYMLDVVDVTCAQLACQNGDER